MSSEESEHGEPKPAAGAYLPIDRRLELAGGDVIPPRSAGAVLVADVAGFTALTGILADRHGAKRGAEEISGLLNQVFEALISRVHDHRGCVIGFSGDAITCWFGGDDGLAALACAFEMHESMKLFDEQSKQASAAELGLRVGVATGVTRRFRVGDPEVQFFDALVGETLDRVTEAEAAAQLGETLLDEQSLDSLGGSVEVTERRIGDAGGSLAVVRSLGATPPARSWGPTPEIDGPAAARWLLPSVYHRLRQGQGEFLTELRLVAPLFINFAGIDYERDEADTRLDAYVCWVQRTLARYDGSLIDITIGDKGSYLYAVFGAPISHEDDAARAAAAALDLRSPPPELDFIREVRIGIGLGRVRTGAYGAPNRRTYGVTGRDVNLAARLMNSASPGEILVSGAFSAAAVGYEFRALGPREFKGTGAVEVFELTGEGSREFELGSEQNASELLGRSHERTRFGEHLRALAEQRQSSTIVVEGEPGIGKSRLLAELRGLAEPLAVRQLRGRSDAIERATPYHAWRTVFTPLFGLEATATGNGAGALESVASQVSRLLEEWTPELVEHAPLLGAVLAIDWPDNALTRHMKGEARAHQTDALLVAVLQAVASREPVLLILEDLHWFDSASWSLLQVVRRDVSPLMLAAATRPLSDAPAEYRELLSQSDCWVLQLDALSADQSRDLVCRCLGVAAIPERLADFVFERAEGHPLFSEQLSYALRDAGLVEVNAGRCRIAARAGELQDLEFPDTVHGVITSRIDRLAPEHQLTIKVASAVGRHFGFRILRAVHPIGSDESTLRSQLDDLARLDLTRVDSQGSDPTYTFKHHVTREVTYESMAFEQRRDLHRSIGSWYEKEHTDDLKPFHAILAHHWRRAEVTPKAVRYSALAGEDALRSFANQEAVELLSEALRLGDTEEGRSQVPVALRASRTRQLAEAYYGIGEMARSRDQLCEAAGLLGTPVPRRAPILVPALMAQMVRPLLPFRRRAGGGGETSLESARVYDLLSLANFFLAELPGSLHAVFVALDQAERAAGDAETSSELVRGLANVGVAYGSIARMHRVADRFIDRANRAAVEGEHLPAQAWVCQVDALYRAKFGWWEDALGRLATAEELYGRLGDRRKWEEVLFIRLSIFVNMGRFDEAARAADDLLASGRRRQDTQTEVLGLSQRALLWLNRAEAGEALDLLEAADSLLPDEAFESEKVLALGLEALARLRLGDSAGSLGTLRRAAPSLAGAPRSLVALEGYAAIAEVAIGLREGGVAMGKSDLAWLEKTAARAFRALNQTAFATFLTYRPRLWLYRGSWAAAGGRSARARRWWRKSLQAAEEYDLPEVKARALCELGRSLGVGDPDRGEFLRQAERLFGELGAEYHGQRARQVLAASSGQR